MAGFFAVGLSGLVVNSAALALFVSVFHVHYVPGLVVATACSTTWNFWLVERWVFTDSPSGVRSTMRRFAQFAAVNVVALLGRGPIVVVLTETFNIHYLLSNAASLGALFVARYLLADKMIWRAPTPSAAIEAGSA